MTYEMLVKLIAQSNLSDAEKQSLYSVDTTNPNDCLAVMRAMLLNLSFESQLEKVRGQLAQLAKQGKKGNPGEVLLKLLNENKFDELKVQLESLNKKGALHGVGLHLLNLVDRARDGKTVIKLGSKSLVEVWDSLDPTKNAGKAFIEDLRSESVQTFAKTLRIFGIDTILAVDQIKQHAFDDLAAILSDRAKINDALAASTFIVIPESSEYHKSKDYLGYITSNEFNPERDFGGFKNLGRAIAYLGLSFPEEERTSLGYGESRVDKYDDHLQRTKAILIALAISGLEVRYMHDIDRVTKEGALNDLQYKLEKRQISPKDFEFAMGQLKILQAPISSPQVLFLKGRLAEVDTVVSEFLKQYLANYASDDGFDADGVFGQNKVDISSKLRHSGFEVVDDEEQVSAEADGEQQLVVAPQQGPVVIRNNEKEVDAEETKPAAVAASHVDNSDKGKGEVVSNRQHDVAPLQAPTLHVDPTIINNALLAVEALYDAKARKQITAAQLKANINAIRELMDAVQSTLPKGPAGADLFMPQIIEVISPFLRGVRNGILAYTDLDAVLSGIDADKLKQIPDYDVTIVKDDNEMPQIGVALYAINQLSSAIRQVGKDARSEDLLNKLHNSELNLEEVTLMEAMDMLYFSINKGVAENKALLKQARKFGDDAHDHPDKAQDVVAILNKVAEVEGLEPLSEGIVSSYLAQCDQANQKIDTLHQACNEYLLHLGREICAAIRDDNFELCQQLVKPGENGRPTLDVQGILNPNEENKAVIEGLRKNNVSLDLAIEKYKAVSEMKSTLNAYDVPTHNLENFSKKFSASRALIETRRDSAATTFLKRVASVLALVVSAIAGPVAGGSLLNRLWKVKGAEEAKKIDQILDDHPQNKNPRK